MRGGSFTDSKPSAIQIAKPNGDCSNNSTGNDQTTISTSSAILITLLRESESGYSDENAIFDVASVNLEANSQSPTARKTKTAIANRGRISSPLLLCTL